jgi:predicted DCC family thiol-disulfide oxidoreductase YuxK
MLSSDCSLIGTGSSNSPRSPAQSSQTFKAAFIARRRSRCMNFVIDRRSAERVLLRNAAVAGRASLLTRVPAPSLSSIILVADDHVYIESTAMLRVCARLQSPWRFLALLLIIPRPVRDAAYRWFAKHRYRWFGRSETCRVPTPDVSGRFIT